MTDLPSRRIVRFGVFQLNVEARELRKHGVRIRLRGQSFAVLAMLLERPGEIVTREELCRRLWSEETFVDFEQGLNGAIQKLRTALHDSPESPRYIETVPRVGYRFIAPVEVLANPEILLPTASFAVQEELTALDRPSETIKAAQTAARHWTAHLAVPLLVVAAALSLIPVARSVFTAPAPAITVGAAHRLTMSSSADRWGRINSDGLRVFFLERKGAAWNAMQVSVSGGDPQPLPVPFSNTRILAVSPNGAEFLMAPFTSRVDPLALWRVPVVGGTPQRVGTVLADDASYSPDGKQLVFSDSAGVYTVGVDGLNPRLIVPLAGIKDSLGWAPNGRTIRFTVHNYSHDLPVSSAIFEADANGTNLHPLLPDWEKEPQQCCGRWAPDGRFYAFVSHNHEGSQGIWLLAESHASLVKPVPQVLLKAGAVVFDQPAPSRDSRHLFVFGSNERQQYALYDPHTGATQGMFAGSGEARWVSFSPDGTWAVCVNDVSEMWRSNIDSAQRMMLVPASFHPRLPRISPDGKQIVFQGFQSANEPWGLYTVSATGGLPVRLDAGQASASAPEWSPDGGKIAYASSAGDGGSPTLFILQLATHSSTKLTGSEGLFRTFWSPDSRYLIGASDDGSQLRLFDWSTHNWQTLAAGKLFGSPAWSPDSRFVYVQDLLESDQPVHRLSIPGLQSKRVDACAPLLAGDVHRCGLEGISPRGELLFRLSRGDHDLYSLDLSIP